MTQDDLMSAVTEVNALIDKASDAASAEALRQAIRACGSANLTFQDVEHYILDGRTFLHIAVGCGRRLAVDVLLEEGARTDVPNGAGLKPLELANNFLEMEKASPAGAGWADWQPTADDYQAIVDAIRQSQGSG